MRRRSFLSTIPLAFIGLTARAGAASELRIVGSGDGMEMVQTLAQEYMAAHPGKTIIVPPSIGTGGGFTAVSTEKEILGRIARARRPPKRRRRGSSRRPSCMCRSRSSPILRRA